MEENEMLPKFLKKYFWEVDLDKLNFRERPEYVALRLLEYGDIKALRWLFRNFSEKKIKNIIKQQKGLSLKSLYFWSSFFDIPEEKILCLKKSYQKRQKSHWPY